MADWGRTLEEILDGMTLPQFRLLTEMRARRIREERRWQLQIAGFSVQSKEQGESWKEMMESLHSMDEGVEPEAQMGGGFTVSKSYPRLDELTPAQVAGIPRLRRLIKFRTIEE